MTARSFSRRFHSWAYRGHPPFGRVQAQSEKDGVPSMDNRDDEESHVVYQESLEEDAEFVDDEDEEEYDFMDLDDPFPIVELGGSDMFVTLPRPGDTPTTRWLGSSNDSSAWTGSSLLSSSSSAPITLDQLSETFAANVSYFYLKNELGLSDTALWRITYEASSALGMSSGVIRQKIKVLNDSMDLTDGDIRTILERQPTILHLSANKNIAPTIQFLVRALELDKQELKTLVVHCPAILCYSIANLESKVNFFTQAMEYTVDECRALLLSDPGLLRSSVTSGLLPRLQFLRQDIKLPLDKIRLIARKNPAILKYSLDRNLVPKLVYYMIMKLQMSSAQVQKILLAYPKILDSNLDRSILPTTMYFVNELDFSLAEFRNMLLKFPRIVTYSLRKIKYVVGYFRFALGLPAGGVKKVLYRAPAVLGLQVDTNVKPKVEFLQRSLDLSNNQLETVLTAMPSLLLLNVDSNLRPKLDYLAETFAKLLGTTGGEHAGSSTTILRDTVLRLPTLLGYSLEQRIRPRVEAIVRAGVDPSSCITIGIPMKQEAFDEWLQRRAKKLALTRETTISATAKTTTPMQSVDGTMASLPALPTRADSKNPIPPKRIVHWSREREPPQFYG